MPSGRASDILRAFSFTLDVTLQKSSSRALLFGRHDAQRAVPSALDKKKGEDGAIGGAIFY
jgi:hypothetical protein